MDSENPNKDGGNQEVSRQDRAAEYQPPGALAEIWAFLRVRKKFWLAPIIIVLVVLGLLMWLSGSAGVVSPFIYAL